MKQATYRNGSEQTAQDTKCTELENQLHKQLKRLKAVATFIQEFLYCLCHVRKSCPMKDLEIKMKNAVK